MSEKITIATEGDAPQKRVFEAVDEFRSACEDLVLSDQGMCMQEDTFRQMVKNSMVAVYGSTWVTEADCAAVAGAALGVVCALDETRQQVYEQAQHDEEGCPLTQEQHENGIANHPFQKPAEATFDLARLRSLRSAASPGQWYIEKWGDGTDAHALYVENGKKPDDTYLALRAFNGACPGGKKTAKANALFAVEAANNMDALLNEIELLRALAVWNQDKLNRVKSALREAGDVNALSKIAEALNDE